jgi:hypothetical protein
MSGLSEGSLWNDYSASRHWKGAPDAIVCVSVSFDDTEPVAGCSRLAKCMLQSSGVDADPPVS